MKKDHKLGEFTCVACWNYPVRCLCGGLLHNEIDVKDGKQIANYECEECGILLTRELTSIKRDRFGD